MVINMDQQNSYIFFNYSYGNLKNKILSFILAMGCNSTFIIKALLFPGLIIAYVADRIIYDKTSFEYGFLIIESIFVFIYIIIDLSYFFIKKGVYIYNNYKVIIKSGYYVTEFINRKFSFYIFEIKSINIYNDKICFKIWENQMQIPKGEEYILIELKNNKRFAFMLENNQDFVDKINEIREIYNGK